MFGIGGQELILILLVALIVLGPKKLPEMAKTIGKALGEFQRATDDFKKEINLSAQDNKHAASKPAQAPEADPGSGERQEAASEENPSPVPGGDGGPTPDGLDGAEDGEQLADGRKNNASRTAVYQPGEIEG